MDGFGAITASGNAVDRGGRLCAQFVDALSLNGASITVFGQNGQQSTICATDSIAARSDELQLELGEGPHWEALATGVPAVAPDLFSGDHSSWPLFTAAVRELGIAAAYAFPMTMGAVVVGAVDLYALTARHLDPDQMSLALSMASRVAATAVHRAMTLANDPESSERDHAPALRREVHQATGMVQAQLDCSATEAFALLRAHTFSSGRSIEDISRDVVARRLDFSQLFD